MAAYCVHQYKYRFICVFGRKRTQESLLKTNIVIKRELFALDMESLTSQMKRMKLEEEVVTLLNPLVWWYYTMKKDWLYMWTRRDGSCSRRIESTTILFPWRKEILISTEKPFEVKDTSRTLLVLSLTLKSQHPKSIFERKLLQAVTWKTFQDLPIVKWEAETISLKQTAVSWCIN